MAEIVGPLTARTDEGLTVRVKFEAHYHAKAAVADGTAYKAECLISRRGRPSAPTGSWRGRPIPTVRLSIEPTAVHSPDRARPAFLHKVRAGTIPLVEDGR